MRTSETPAARGLAVGSTRERGVILAAAAWLAVLITVLAMTLTTAVRTEISITGNRRDAAQVRALAEGGIHYGALELIGGAREDRWSRDGQKNWFEMQQRRISIEIQDEAGKIDLNAAPDTLLHGLLSELGVDDPERRLRVVDALRDWSDPDDVPRPFGAEKPSYRDTGRVPKNASFTRVAELRQVLGVDRDLYQALHPFVTVHSRRARINPWTAPPTVLRAVPGLNASAVERYIEERRSARENEQRPRSPPAGRDHFLVAEARAFEITARVHAEEGATRTLSAIVAIGSSRGNRPFRILAWRP